jgi:hypothetical protein
VTLKHPFSTRRGRALRDAKLKATPRCEQCGAARAAGERLIQLPLRQGWEWHAR